MTAPRRSPALLLVLTLLVMLAQTIAAAADVATPQAEHIPATLATDDPGHTGRQPGPAPAGALEERWSLSPVSKYTAVFSGDKLFLNSDWDIGATYAYSAITGDMIWRTETGDPNYSIPVAAEDGVFVSSTTGLWSLDAETGDVLWFIENHDPENLSYSIAPLAAAEGVLYADLGDRWIAVDALTGAEIWQRPPHYAHSVVFWQNQLFAATGIPAAIIALDTDTGLESGRTPIELTSDDLPELAVDDSGLYLSSAGSVSAFDLEDLQPRWSVKMAGYTSAPTIGNGVLFVSDLDGLHALDVETGVELWMLAGAEPTRPLIAGTTVYVIVGSELTAVSELDGSVIWTFPTTGTLEAIANGLIYIGPRWVSGNTSAIGGDQLVHATPEVASAAVMSPEAAAATPVSSPAATGDAEALAGTGVPMFRVDSVRGGVNPGPMPEGLPTQLWSTEIGENNLLVSSPIVWGDVVIAGGETALYAMDVASGQIRWSYAYQGDGQRSDAVLVPGGVLMWESSGVRLLDLETGRILWENLTLFVYPNSIAVADGVAFVGAFDGVFNLGKAFAIDVQTGVTLWSIELPDGQPQAPAAVSNGVVYLTTLDLANGTYDGSLYALDPPPTNTATPSSEDATCQKSPS